MRAAAWSVRVPLGLLSLLPLVVTLAALPFVVRAFPFGAERRRAGGALMGLALAFAGFYSLYWSATACWILVGLGAFFVAATAGSWRKPAVVGGVSGAALAFGLAFEWIGGDAGILAYVAGASPMLLGGAVAFALASWLRWDAGWRAQLAALALASVFTLVPFTSFWPTFLLTFEPMHVPLLLAALGGIALFARHAPSRASAARAPDVGAFVARDAVPPAWPYVAFAAACTLAGALVSWLAAPSYAPLVVGVAVVAVASAALARSAYGAAGALAAGAALSTHGAFLLHGRAEAGGVAEAAALALGALAGTAAVMGLALALAGSRDVHAREVVATRRESVVARESDLAAALPPHAHVREAKSASPSAFDKLARAAANAGATTAVLVVRAPADDPFWTLDERTYDALIARSPSPVRVHVAIVEGTTAHLLPPVFSDAEVEA